MGNLWLAVYNGGCVLCINPNTKTLITKIPMPGKYITCVQFGGDDLQDLYVSSATVETPKEDLINSPYLGGTFILTGLGIKGCESIPADI